MNPLIMLAIMGAGAYAQTKAQEAKARQQAKLQGVETANSPFTGIAPTASPPDVTPVGNALAWGSQGLGMSQGMQMQDALMQALTRGGNGGGINPDVAAGINGLGQGQSNLTMPSTGSSYGYLAPQYNLGGR